MAGGCKAETLVGMELVIKAVLIDLDGTLVDTLGDFVAALGAVAQERAWPAPGPDQVRRWIGRGGDQLIRDWLTHLGQPASLDSAVKARYDYHYRAFNGQQAYVRAGTVEGLQGLRALGLPLACVTNKPQANAEALLAALGVSVFFQAVVGGAPDLKPKPAPDGLLRAAAQLDIAIEGALMVGDSANDAAAARAAGCSGVVLLRGGYNHGQPIEAEPAWAHLDTMADVPPLIAGGCCASLCPAATP